ncbi:ferrochelatase [Aestuariispira ectoiniformans]|uniref:ferrochelatase n=1 Tax=Aestuariispira ectoiniformans TaxID=2775080 RepID=UPI0021F0974D|nr:ferrochelatase [Aestuariispira ectoiniformans]
MGQKTAIILFNLGGPDGPETVKPFLFNLFNDPAIIGLPQPFRWLLAKLISGRRAPEAAKIYEELGGRSPLLPNTKVQAKALEKALEGDRGSLGDVRCFIAMRYWHPFAHEAASAAREWGADQVVLLPLYPQYSTTTTGSSLKDWKRAASNLGFKPKTRAVCCYPGEEGFVDAVADKLKATLAELGDIPQQDLRILFSAHGLPQKVIDGGDPYQKQVEATAAAIMTRIADTEHDWLVCYQSRVGPLEWIKPYTEEEIRRAGAEKKHLVVVPIAFVSEHSETLVELDIEYRDLARECGVPGYHRVGTVDDHPAFIEGLARIVRDALERENAGISSNMDCRICGEEWSRCAMAAD